MMAASKPRGSSYAISIWVACARRSSARAGAQNVLINAASRKIPKAAGQNMRFKNLATIIGVRSLKARRLAQFVFIDGCRYPVAQPAVGFVQVVDGVARGRCLAPCVHEYPQDKAGYCAECESRKNCIHVVLPPITKSSPDPSRAARLAFLGP